MNLLFFQLLLSIATAETPSMRVTDPVQLNQFKSYIDVQNQVPADKVIANNLLKEANPNSFVTGYTSGNVWIGFELQNTSNQSVEKTISIDYPLIDELDIYNVIGGQPVRSASTGISRGRHSRPVDSSNFAFNVNILPGDSIRYLVRAKSNTSMTFPISIWDPEKYRKWVNTADFIFGIYIGLILLMILYNLSIGLAARDINHIFYAFAIFFFHGFSVLTLFGYPSRYFWPESSWFTTRQISVSEGLASSFSVLFGYSFLEISKNLPKTKPLFIGLCGSGILVAVYGLFFQDIPSLAMAASIAAITSIALMSVGAYLAVIKKSRSAKFYFVAWSAFFVSMLAFLLKYLGIIQNNDYSTDSILIGGSIEAIILSFALGDKIRFINSEKFESQKKAFETIRIAKDEQDNFIANTSHELRTPVGIILGLSDAILRMPELPTQVISNIQMIRISGARLADLVEDLLTAGRLKQMKVLIKDQDLDLNEIIMNMVELSRPSIKKALDLRYQPNANLPLIKGDQHRIEQILTNLIDNAIKFSDHGDIVIKAEERDDLVHVSVSDHGIGIADQELENIFIAFRQLDTGIERRAQGLGLGLHIVKELVELQGGQVFVDSLLNHGSTFRFTLRKSFATVPQNSKLGNLNMRLNDDSEKWSEESEQTKKTSFDHLFRSSERVCILAVDDEPGNRLLLQQIFPADKFDLKLASNAHEAMSLIQSEWQPALAILDVMMPVVGGIRLTKMLRERFDENELPIVLLTAKGTLDTLVEGFEAGANEFVTKPVNAIELISRVNKHLQLADFRKVAGLFVPPGLVSLFNEKKLSNLKLGTYRSLERAVLFSDIRNFSSLSEKLSDEELYKFTMHYFLRMAPVVRKFNGFIDKFMGDGIMAVFEKSEDCVSCAIEMIRILPEYNAARAEHNRSIVSVGIGLHMGGVVAGIVGDPERLAATVLGNKVNTASRLESVTKTYNVDIVASAQIIQALSKKPNAPIRFIDRVLLYGKEEPTELWEIIALRPEEKNCDSKAIQQLNSLVASKQWQKAHSTILEMLAKHPNDSVLHHYAELIRRGLAGEEMPFDANGNFMFLKKGA